MPPHDFWDLTVSYVCVTAVGLVINCGLIIILFNFKLSSKLTLILLRIQSVADAASCLFSILTCTTQSHPTGNQVIDWISCRFWDSQLFYWISVVLSTSNLVWVTIDRLWATVYAVTYKRNFRRYLILSSVASCLYTAFLVIPVSLLVDHRNGSCQAMFTATTLDTYYSHNVHPYLWLVTYYFLPSFIMLCVHMRVLHFMRRMNRRNAAANALEQEKGNHLLFPFTICTVGLAIGLIGAHGYGTYYYVIETTNTVFYEPGSPSPLLSVFLTTLNCCINPIILLTTLPQLRQKFISAGHKCVQFWRENLLGRLNPVDAA